MSNVSVTQMVRVNIGGVRQVATVLGYGTAHDYLATCCRSGLTIWRIDERAVQYRTLVNSPGWICMHAR